MMSRFDVTKLLAIAALLVALLAISGCSQDSTPTASEDQARLESVAVPSAVLSFGAGPEPAAKVMDDDEDDDDDGEDDSDGRKGRDRRDRDDDGEEDDGDLTDTDEIGPKGGKLKVKDEGPKLNPDGSRAKAKLEVEFKIPKDALEDEQIISMTVSGYYLSELEIAFTPAGLAFAEEAQLKIKVDRDRVDLDVATLYGIHSSAAGDQVVLVDVEVKGGGDVILNVRVPGFSRYGLGE